ncbi:MAG: type II toxin-antitoxin system RelE/ParE family toxin [Anaerolineae bacterium]|nr:type II toxin-antitoxin system RelE/ParE family toxin [Anaerolineae bacterium]
MIEVLGTDEFEQWFLDLNEADSMAVARVVGLLEAKGTALGFPYSSSITGSQYPLRELRVQSGGRPLRVFYAFDPLRQAVLLLGGNKTGDNRFYLKMIPRAEALWESYLQDLSSND